MSNSSGLAWSAAKGTVAALRLADHIPGARQGFRPLQFTARISSGAGGPLVVSQGDPCWLVVQNYGWSWLGPGAEADLR